jgi:hypothetical protein
MKFKVGDKVKFLNESGGGIISEIVSNIMVKVAVEDGFDLPTLTRELVLIETSSYSGNLFKEDFNVKLKTESIKQSEQATISQTPSYSKNLKWAKEEAGVYLAFVPNDQQWMITGMVDVMLVNHTSYDILYSLFLKNRSNKFNGYDYSSVEPKTAILLETIDREQTEFWNEGVVQILYHADEIEKILLPVHTNFKVKQHKLNNENSYMESGLVDGRAYIVSLNEIRHQKNTQVFLGKEEDLKEQKSIELKEKALIDKHQTLPKIAEVDLHIGELLDNISGLDSRDMFAVQKKYFRNCLDSAIANNYKKVTFIHGVGNGKLKSSIVEILKEYENIENQSASLAKYGVGAIDVLIKPWS